MIPDRDSRDPFWQWTGTCASIADRAVRLLAQRDLLQCSDAVPYRLRELTIVRAALQRSENNRSKITGGAATGGLNVGAQQ
jgi:hypothetical protein